MEHALNRIVDTLGQIGQSSDPTRIRVAGCGDFLLAGTISPLPFHFQAPYERRWS